MVRKRPAPPEGANQGFVFAGLARATLLYGMFKRNDQRASELQGMPKSLSTSLLVRLRHRCDAIRTGSRKVFPDHLALGGLMFTLTAALRI